MKISIIIPTYNEEKTIGRLLQVIKNRSGKDEVREVIVCDGGSMDNTRSIADKLGARVLISTQKGRAAQMNHGAAVACGEVLHFIHADCVPPKEFTSLILKKLPPGTQAGCFMSKFDMGHWFLRLGNYLSFLPFWFCRGGGQTLWVTRELFHRVGGYDERMKLMEEYDLIARLKKQTRFRVIRRFVIASARDYRRNGALRLQFIYMKVFRMYAQGATQDELLAYVKERVRK
ncbi:TIGR04283 family arsenosugar biosynthesis glycosyltransferase [Roseivirga sp. BDSF3-8]|uniref:TIGR04283 family arsenosugar biosynthesis glycosyltransferase n=1 Tax=Roseivirga sp. BDSF3-8 TaxID=3241598 RepID=UPI003531B985